MQLVVLALVIGIFLAEDLGPRAQLDAPTALLLVILPKLALAVVYWVMTRLTLRSLGRPRAYSAMRWLDTTSLIYRIVTIKLYTIDLLILGLLDQTRRWLGGNLVLVDELLVMLPSLLLLVWHWWAYYPIDRRLRDASLIGRLDAGLPIHVPMTRAQYLLNQLRHQVALILLPLLLILTWYELVQGGFAFTGLTDQAQAALLLAGAFAVFLMTPLIIRYVWDTARLPDGEMRDRLLAMCRQHRIGVRELLLWRTFGGAINAAVMGVVAPVRYILLSDALLEMVPTRQIEAVMAHEVAHVRKHHLFWLLVAAGASLHALMLFWALALNMVGVPDEPTQIVVLRAGLSLGALGDVIADPQTRVATVSVLAMVSWFFVFGFISRRFERQADTFAVQHASQQLDQPMIDDGGRSLVDSAAVATMTAALQQVADLNHIPVARRSWRHGSIAYRQAYLRTLVGQPVDALSIDRQVRWIKLLSALLVAGILTLFALYPQAMSQLL